MIRTTAHSVFERGEKMSSLDLSVQSTFVTLLLIFSFTAVEAQLQPELCERIGAMGVNSDYNAYIDVSCKNDENGTRIIGEFTVADEYKDRNFDVYFLYTCSNTTDNQFSDPKLHYSINDVGAKRSSTTGNRLNITLTGNVTCHAVGCYMNYVDFSIYNLENLDSCSFYLTTSTPSSTPTVVSSTHQPSYSTTILPSTTLSSTIAASLTLPSTTLSNTIAASLTLPSTTLPSTIAASLTLPSITLPSIIAASLTLPNITLSSSITASLTLTASSTPAPPTSPHPIPLWVVAILAPVLLLITVALMAIALFARRQRIDKLLNNRRTGYGLQTHESQENDYIISDAFLRKRLPTSRSVTSTFSEFFYNATKVSPFGEDIKSMNMDPVLHSEIEATLGGTLGITVEEAVREEELDCVISVDCGDDCSSSSHETVSCSQDAGGQSSLSEETTDFSQEKILDSYIAPLTTSLSVPSLKINDGRRNSRGYIEPLYYRSNESLAGDESLVGTSMSHPNLNCQGYILMEVLMKSSMSRNSLH